jgi:hypothetical protein
MHGGPLPATNDLQHLLGAVEALGGRVPDLVDQVLRRAVALGVGGYLFLLGGEFHPLQLLLELTHIEVTQVHACLLCLRSHVRCLAYPSVANYKR